MSDFNKVDHPLWGVQFKEKGTSLNESAGLILIHLKKHQRQARLEFVWDGVTTLSASSDQIEAHRKEGWKKATKYAEAEVFRPIFKSELTLTVPLLNVLCLTIALQFARENIRAQKFTIQAAYYFQLLTLEVTSLHILRQTL